MSQPIGYRRSMFADAVVLKARIIELVNLPLYLANVYYLQFKLNMPLSQISFGILIYTENY